jgi:hypothetical protein
MSRDTGMKLVLPLAMKGAGICRPPFHFSFSVVLFMFYFYFSKAEHFFEN